MSDWTHGIGLARVSRRSLPGGRVAVSVHEDRLSLEDGCEEVLCLRRIFDSVKDVEESMHEIRCEYMSGHARIEDIPETFCEHLHTRPEQGLPCPWPGCSKGHPVDWFDMYEDIKRVSPLSAGPPTLSILRFTRETLSDGRRMSYDWVLVA